MSRDHEAREAVVDDAYYVRLGYDQEYLDQNPPLFVWTDSDTDLSDADRRPLTPPQSPKGNGPDISWKAWNKCIWADRSRGIGPRDSGFADYETWKSYVLFRHARKVLRPTMPPRRSELPKKRRPPPITNSERQAKIIAPFCSQLIEIRETRSKTSAASSFYELDHSNNTRILLPTTRLTHPSKSRAPSHMTKPSRVRKHRAKHRHEKVNGHTKD